MSPCAGRSPPPPPSPCSLSRPAAVRRSRLRRERARRPPVSPTPSPTPEPEPEPAQEGIDASHHQGPIDWPRVAEAGIAFAYLKATEGTGFTDPRFAEHRRAARRAGIAVGGYHYFQLCTDGTAQAEHLLAVLGDDARGPRDLAPALDLELAGSCAQPPPADVLLGEVREFLDLVERRLGVRAVVYLYPAFEERFGFADDLASYPQWVRRLGDRAPGRTWTVWQYDDRGSVPGIAGGVDRNRTAGGPPPGTSEPRER